MQNHRQKFSDWTAQFIQHECVALRMDTNARNASARKLYHKLGYEEIGIVACIFNGIPDVQLVCLGKYIG